MLWYITIFFLIILNLYNLTSITSIITRNVLEMVNHLFMLSIHIWTMIRVSITISMNHNHNTCLSVLLTLLSRDCRVNMDYNIIEVSRFWTAISSNYNILPKYFHHILFQYLVIFFNVYCPIYLKFKPVL